MLSRMMNGASGLLRPWPKMRSYSHLVAAHSSWFKIPEEGMTENELLARGSAFFVRGPSTGRMIALFSAHVAAPHRYVNYFPQEWLQHVEDANCRSLIEKRSRDGSEVESVISDVPLVAGFRHSALDVAAVVLPIEKEKLVTDSKMAVLRLRESDELHAGEDVNIGGYRLVGESGSGTEAVIEVKLEGQISELIQRRAFVNTGMEDSEMGMCGGPVVTKKDKQVCVGILEGLVPRIKEGQEAEETHRRVEGHSVIITARELHKFLHDVETETARNASRKQYK